MDVAELLIAPAELVALDDPKADAATVSERLETLTGERPTLQIDLTDAGVLITARCAGVETTGSTADEATTALAPETASVVRAATLQREAQTATAQAMVDVASAVVGAVVGKVG